MSLLTLHGFQALASGRTDYQGMYKLHNKLVVAVNSG